MDILLKYGPSSLQLNLAAAAADLFVLQPGRFAASGDEDEPVRAALAAPIDSSPLSELVAPGQRVAIVTSDITRPCPSARLLPPVLGELARGGVRDRDITVVFGLGTHRPHTAEERMRLAGQAVYQRVRCIDSDSADVKRIGSTSRGTPIDVFRPVLQADVRVCLGVIEYHYFVGYSGGVKALVPGVCGVETVQRNHRMMTAPGAVAGNWQGNPVRQDIEEAGARIGAHFLLNVILDGGQRVVWAVAGDALSAHRAGCAHLDAVSRPSIERPADIVIVSAGGFPKDINLYQAQKALDNARLIVRPGGVIVLLAECVEGMGNTTFEAWMRDPGGPQAILARIREQFVLGGHKAAAVALAMQQAELYLVSALDPGLARSIGFVPYASLDEAVRSALAHVGNGATVAVMPEGGSVLPVVAQTARRED
jgi:nickel-dependent lactate racemase